MKPRNSQIIERVYKATETLTRRSAKNPNRIQAQIFAHPPWLIIFCMMYANIARAKEIMAQTRRAGGRLSNNEWP